MSSEGKKTEKAIVDILYKSIKETGVYDLVDEDRRVPLKGRGLGEVFKNWYPFELAFEPEIDLVLVFRDYQKTIEDALIIAVEIKYFSGESESKRFSSGLDQTMSYGSVGFDGISLWHIFSETIDEDTIKRYAAAMQEILLIFNIPLCYFPIRRKGDGDFQLYNGLSFYDVTPSYMATQTRIYFTNENGKNRLFSPQREQMLSMYGKSRLNDIKKRRKALKTVLKIPV
jgi:hypothetical protein